jgi:hypothetical protein
MAGPAPTVGVIGLRALNRDLTRMCADNGELNRAFQAAGREAASPVATAARASFPQDTGTLSGDVRVTGTRSGATVRVGRASIRYAGWVEFGGRRRVPHESERPYVATGRYLFPAARNLSSAAATAYTSALTRALDSFGWSNPSNSTGTGVHD